MKKKKVFDYQKYKDYISSADWLIKKSRFIVTYLRRGWSIQCNKCNSTKDLQIHHIDYKRLFNEKTEDLMILCRKCHEYRHQNKKDFDKEMWDSVMEIIDKINKEKQHVKA